MRLVKLFSGVFAVLIIGLPTAPALSENLYISEVVANYRREKGAPWVELINHSGKQLNLKDFKLRALGLNVENGSTSRSAIIFDLPSIIIAKNEYVVIAGQMRDDLNNSRRYFYVKNDKGYVPYWTDSGGFVELIDRNKKTIDFIRFGNNRNKPITTKSWRGENVKGFQPRQNEFHSISPDPLDNYDNSLVMLTAKFKISGTKRGCTLSHYPTPGGK